MINMLELTASGLKSGKYEKDFPELYSLKNCVENNAWHNNESVFDHTIKVLENMEKILENIKNVRMEKWLDEKIDKMTRKELLLISALLHDIAKGESLVKNSDGTTYSPGHEKIAGNRIKEFSALFGMGRGDAVLVEKIIRRHGEMHSVLGSMINGNNAEIEVLKKSYVYFELLLLGHADTLNSFLSVSKPAEYKKRIEFYRDGIGVL